MRDAALVNQGFLEILSNHGVACPFRNGCLHCPQLSGPGKDTMCPASELSIWNSMPSPRTSGQVAENRICGWASRWSRETGALDVVVSGKPTALRPATVEWAELQLWLSWKGYFESVLLASCTHPPAPAGGKITGCMGRAALPAFSNRGQNSTLQPLAKDLVLVLP